jgi:hypothetical protein
MAASLSDILTSMQNGVNAMNAFVSATSKTIPTNTSGQLAASVLVQTGFVRVLGVSIVAGGAAGSLADAATLALAVSGTEVYTTPTTTGFYATDMVFVNGLVYLVGAGQTVALFYART